MPQFKVLAFYKTEPILQQLFTRFPYLLFAILMCFCSAQQAEAQVYFACQTDHGQDFLVRVNRGCKCPSCCQTQVIGPTRKWEQRIAISGQREVFGIDAGFTDDLYKIDTLTGNSTLVMNLSGLGFVKGMIAIGGGIFYVAKGASAHHADELVQINVGANTITSLGSLEPWAIGDFCFLEGEIYYPAVETGPFQRRYVAKLDLATPLHSLALAQIPWAYYLTGFSASDVCNTLIGVDTLGGDETVYVSIKDGSVSPLCRYDGLLSMTSTQELKPTTVCNDLDLDCNDSSNALQANFNADTFDCLANHVKIVDFDVQAFQDTLIEEMTIHLTGFVPDGTEEYLQVTGTNAFIQVTGANTSLVKLENGGTATFTDFNYMLQRMFYNNDALYPTGGTRTIEVQFKTYLGNESDVAITFVPVIELPVYEINLGDDQILCGGESITLDATNPGAHYEWSNGSTNAKIFVNHAGQYFVHVFGNDKCPNWDTVDVDVLPVIEVSLTGDDILCGDSEAFINIQVSSTIDIDVQLSANDSIFTIEGISGNYNFDWTIDTTTTFTILNVIPELEACLELGETEITVETFPSYEISLKDTICEGDSVLIGLTYQKVAGVYDNSFYTEAGCDSAVSTTLTVIPLPKLFRQTTSCDTAAVGVFLTLLPNAVGCDTLLQTTVIFQSSDTTRINTGTCRLAEAGNVITSMLINQHGCDSIVITTLVYVPPSDTIRIFGTSCIAAQQGTFQALLTDVTGCDSLVYTTITQAPSDTTYLNTSSCNPANVGVFQTLLTNQDGCDSLLINTVSFSGTDTIFISGTTCNPANVGMFETHFNGSDGCDSTVFSTVTFSDHDEVFLQGSSCNPSETGVFVNTFVNQLGCDSIVTLTISLLASNVVAIQSTTCNQASAGVFVHNLINQFGCDSIVTETITLVPSIQTSQSSTTCRSADAGVFVSTYTAQSGCDSIVTLTVTLIPADTTTFLTNTCDPSQVGSIENTFINVDGCDSLVITATVLFPVAQLQANVTSNYHGFGISCFGESDGSVSAIVNGIPPITYLWSNNSSSQTLTDVPAGQYSVTIIDGNGCEAMATVNVTQPPLLAASFDVVEPGCTGPSQGTITADAIGGTPPIQYSSNGGLFQSSPSFNNLSDGSYDIVVRDVNGCEVEQTFQVDVPIRVTITLGDNQVVEPGTTVTINALVNVPPDSLSLVEWTGLQNPSCPTCLTQEVSSLVTTSYTVTVTSLDGCTAEDAVTIFIGKKTDINVANIFSPNNDQKNDIIWITGGVDVKTITSWRIFDRWGNQVFNAENFAPNDPAFAWDGTWKNKALNVGVFTYQLIAELKDGKQVIRYGDVTLIR